MIVHIDNANVIIYCIYRHLSLSSISLPISIYTRLLITRISSIPKKTKHEKTQSHSLETPP